MMNFKGRIAAMLVFAGAVSLAGARVEADPPGSVFVELSDKSTMVIELNDKSAIVVQPPSNRATATISKPDSNLSEEAAAAMAAGGQPVGPSIILSYRSQLYIVPAERSRSLTE